VAYLFLKDGKVTRSMKMIFIAVLSCVLLSGCASQPIDIHSASTNELLDRRAEINRKIKEDDFGVYIGVTRWISHASEKKSALEERAAIDAELERRHVKPRDLRKTSTENTEE
jgi:hypothetical protein